ncbi:MAG: EutN/CcmL family microcompartment protein [Gemmataceae bacterium]|nr:EutN/CcmL family microcompartment protein [Gemmataceae bacterium]
MQLGTVVGHATSTVKHRTLVGRRLLVVQLTTPGGGPDGEPVLAADELGAGLGSRVLVTTDAVLVREMTGAKDSPLRYTVMGLADE